MISEVNIKIGLRDTHSSDRDLLLQIYGSTRAEELEQVPYWDNSQKQAFVFQQFNAQDVHYKNVFPDAQYNIITYEGKDAGRLYVERNRMPGKIHVIDISLLPEFRNKGIATVIFRQLQNEAIQLNKSVSIHVEKFNKARHLYDRLGFVVKSETNGIYYLMEWNN